jgi:hypothetical protein
MTLLLLLTNHHAVTPQVDYTGGLWQPGKFSWMGAGPAPTVRQNRSSSRPRRTNLTKADPYVLSPIQGIMPDSKEEYWVAIALDTLGQRYYYQYKIKGGQGRIGGQAIDFMCLTPILMTPLKVNGLYWHSGANAQDDKLKDYELMRVMRGKIFPPKTIWDFEVPSPEAALVVVKARMNL